MKRRVVDVPGTKAPAAPLSRGIVANGVVYCSGQLPVDLKTGEFIGGDIRAQTGQVLENLKRVLMEAGSGLERVLKTTVYLTDFDDFAAMNQVYREYFPSQPPARTTVGITRLARQGARIEIECVALA